MSGEYYEIGTQIAPITLPHPVWYPERRHGTPICGSRTNLLARRCHLTRRTACSRNEVLTIEYGKTKRDLGIAMNHPLESFAQPDGTVEVGSPDGCLALLIMGPVLAA